MTTSNLNLARANDHTPDFRPGMTWGEARAEGWKIYDMKLYSGYLSRRTKIDDQRLCVAGGRRQGEVYFDSPNWESTRYGIIRCYVRPGKGVD